MLDLDGLSLSCEEKELIENENIGGVIFFARNFESRLQLVDLVNEIRAIRPEILLCVDQEGGRVQRFRNGFTAIPPMQVLGEMLACEKPGAEELLRDCGWLLASEVLSCGVDFSFAPVLDVDKNACEVISDRSFNEDPRVVTQASRYFMEGMHEAGMAVTGKHFPGHGGVRADSHLETPYDERSLEDIRQRDLKPFSSLTKQLDAVMPAHIVFPNIDPNAVGFSSFWLQQILRGELAYDGVIFSDDLSMKGADIAGDYSAKARSALGAGCDMVLVCNNRAGALEVLNFLDREKLPFSKRLPQMRMRKQPNWEELKSETRWLQTVEKLSLCS